MVQRPSYRSLPAVRRKRRIEAALLAAFAASLAVLCALGARLHPSAIAMTLLLGAAALTAVLQKEAVRNAHRRLIGVTEVTDRAQAPVLWDAVQAAAAAAGVRPPKVYLIDDVMPLQAASWGFGTDRSLGMRRGLAGRLPPDWILAAVSHEIAHGVMNDLAFTALLQVLRAWLRLAAYGLFGLGIVTLFGPSAFDHLWTACGACVAGLVGVIMPDAILSVGLHRLRYAREYAADAVGIALTGNPKAAMALMIFFALAGRDASTDPVPRPGRSHPPPLARVEAMIAEHPQIRPRRRP